MELGLSQRSRCFTRRFLKRNSRKLSTFYAVSDRAVSDRAVSDRRDDPAPRRRLRRLGLTKREGEQCACARFCTAVRHALP
eukprot:1564780-Pleurochrysis_carterae.AAC.1